MEAAVNIMPEDENAIWQIMGLSELGMICFTMILKLLAPHARAASMNSCPTSVTTEERTRRAYVAMEEKDSAISRLVRFAPNAATTAIASRIDGMLEMMSMQRMMIKSRFFP